MSGYNTILRIRKIEERVDKLGFMLAYPRHRSSYEGDYVALKPKDEHVLPIYVRDAEVFTGTLEELQVWLTGVEWARDYDSMLRLSDDKKRIAAEDKERTRQQLAKERAEKRKVFAILSNKSEEEIDLNPKETIQ
jgi:hypothetical protein